LRYRGRPEQTTAPLAPGDVVTLTEPPFGPREATVVRCAGSHVVVEFELAGRTARVAVRP